MTAPAKLEDTTVQTRLSEIPGWEFRDGRLHREFRFKDFVNAFQFMTESAKLAEKLQHHPDWHNVYNQVNVDLNTHDANGITDLDFQMAKGMNDSFDKISGK